VRGQRRVVVRRARPRLAQALVRVADDGVDADAQLGAGAVVRGAERVDVLDVEVAAQAARQRCPGAACVRAGQLPDQQAVVGGGAGAVVIGEDAVGVSGLAVGGAAGRTLNIGRGRRRRRGGTRGR
jgi:hypothetical protein